MRTVIVNEDIFTEPDDVHRYLAQRLDFPSYYGHNLDALQDCLGDISDPIRVYLVRTANKPLQDDEGEPWFGRLCRVFSRAADENPNVAVVFCRIIDSNEACQ